MEAPRRWTTRIFAASWVGYSSYYFTRKHFSVAKSSLGIGEVWLGWIDVAYLIGYSAGQFIAGALGDRLGSRRLITTGLLASAVLTVAFASASLFTTSVIPVYITCFALNGLAQATGWPGSGKLMASWFSSERRAEIMGIWSTCLPAGGLATNFVAGWLLGWGWRQMFVGMATWVALVAVGFWFVARDRPSDVGFDDPEVKAGITAAERRAAYRAAWPAIVSSPLTWALGLCYFGVKLVRYGLLFWLPYYLATSKLHYSSGASAIIATAFEVGGIPFSILAGSLADRVFGRRRIAVACVSAAGLVGSVFLYDAIGDTSLFANVTILAMIGAFLFATDSLVSGSASQDIGGPHAAALACGLINGVGSVGAVAQAVALVPIKQAYGWGAVFTLFEAAAVLSFVALLPFVRVKPREIPLLPRAKTM